jgi:branched-chain amino acid transport system substrate-binding protein
MKMKRKITISLIILAVIVAGIAIYFAQKPKEPETIKIGAILPLTGPAAQLGLPKKNAFILAMDEINISGGVSGKRISIIFEDNKGIPAEGVSALQKLINIDKIKIFYVDITAVAMACVPVADKNRVVMFVGSAHPNITEGSDWVFRVFTSGALEAKLLSRYLNKEGVKSAYILYINDPLGQETKRIFEEEFSGKVVGADAFQKDEQNFRAIVQKIKKLDPEKIAIFDYGIVLPTILKQLLEGGVSSRKIVGNIGFAGPRVRELSPDMLEDVIFTAPAYIYRLDNLKEQSLEMRNFINKYKAKFGVLPDYTAAFAYDAIMILIDAIKKYKDNPVKIREYLLSVKNFQGVSGKVTILPNGDSITDIVLATYKEGKIKPLSE